MKNITLKFMLFLILFTVFTAFTPATESYALDDSVVNVTIGDDGAVTVEGSAFQDNRQSAWNDLIGRYKGFIAGIAGIATITMIVLFIMQFMKLAASAGNPQARSQALVGVLWTGIATACLGAVTIIVGFFYKSIGTDGATASAIINHLA